MHGVQDCVEVGSVGPATLRVGVLHVLHDSRVRFELGEDVVHTKLVELGHVDEPAFVDFEKLLLSFENLSKEVSVCGGLWRDIKLHYTHKLDVEKRPLTVVTQVGEQILLRAELVGQLIGAEGCAIVSLDGTCGRVHSHLGVLYHGLKAFWKLLIIELDA